MALKKVAVVDDDLEMTALIRDILATEKYAVTTYSSASEALARFKKDTPHVLLTDLKMSEIDGMMLLRKMHQDYPNIVCIMMTAFGSIETAIDAMKTGAYHYIVKPFKNDELQLVIKRAFERASLISENAILRRELTRNFTVDNIIGKSPPMLELFEIIKRISNATANVLIQGESGTGKELVARAIHNSGERKSAPFIPINCAAIPEHLLESELFGHVRGSFTGAISDKKGLIEEANGGTLFLDEIGDMSLPLQAKLLRVLQDREIRSVGSTQIKPIDVRIISATHRDLKTLASEGKFREDLYYRLNVIPIHVPALRDRKEDIPLLVNNFLEKFSALNNSKVQSISEAAMATLIVHPWPGNVRELENVIERAVVLARSEQIQELDIMGTVVEKAKESIQGLYSDRPTMDKLEERYIKLVLGESQNQKEVAARTLGISRRTLYRKERAYGLIADDVPEPAEH